jgi:cytochrome d ubiquinol oxidase subunit I
MHTPAGYQWVNGKFMVTDFRAAILNPSASIRFGHMTIAAFETSAFVVAGISGYYLLKGRDVSFFRHSMGLALLMAGVLAPLQIFLGDVSGRRVFDHQPAKFAAMEAHWETNATGGAPFVIIAFPDEEKERNVVSLSIPYGLSLLVTQSFEGRVPGLKEFPPKDRPNVFILFWSFRLMVAIGFVFFLLMVWALILWLRGKLYEDRPFLWTLFILHPLGFIATELGWIANEVGRQPWLVYNLMRTGEGLSPIPVGNVLWSLTLFTVIFVVVLVSYFHYVLKTLRRGPDLSSPIPPVQRPAGMKPLGGMDSLSREKALIEE